MTLEIRQAELERVLDPVPAGLTVLAALSGVPEISISAPCGGKGRCGKCVVQADPPPPPSEADARFLTPDQIVGGYRLACTCPAAEVRTVVVSEREETARVKGEIPRFTVPAAIWPRARAEGTWAAAIDIGTTTVAVYLLDTAAAEVVAVRAEMNRQGIFGADVISRISYSEESPAHLERLAGAIRGQLRGMLQQLSRDRGAINTVVITGNTTMLHLIAGVSPAGIGRAPFVAEFLETREYSAGELNLGNQGAVILLPSVAAYVGADIVSAAVAAEMDRTASTTLLVDIGTNGELALSHQGHLYTCATAAGPAFEGACISAGVGGIAGAINSWNRRGDRIVTTTIADAPAVGICGAGLLDLMAQMLADGVVDETGRMESAEGYRDGATSRATSPGASPNDALLAWQDRLTEHRGEPAVRISETHLFTQQDVREVQLAKAAIAAGIDVLCHDAGITPRELDQVVLTGGFGNHLRVESAVATGLVPDLPRERYISVDNAAGRGAVLVLRNEDTLERTRQLASQANYIELSGHAFFQERYVEHMMFPEEE